METLKEFASDAAPFVKWAGGKGQLLHTFEAFFPRDFGTYLEPFLGGGAVFFYLFKRGRIGQARISDANKDLINCYVTIRDNLDQLLVQAKRLQKHATDKKYYYEVARKRFNEIRLETGQEGNVEKAALLLYLNRTCFNGLYRVNSNGAFNVPWGDYTNPRILNERNLGDVSWVLNQSSVKILRRDYTVVLDEAKAKDFVYFDPTKAYQVRVYEGVYSCECRGYRTHRTICKHIRGVVAECLSGIAASDPAVRDFATLAAFECLKKPDIQMQIRYSLDLLTRWQLVENRNGTYKITDLGESAARSYLPLNRLHALWEHMRTLKQVKSDREYLALVYADSEGITPDLIDVRVLDSLEEWMKGEPPEQIVVTGRYKKYQEFLEVRDAIVYALENCIDFASIIGRDALVKYIRNLRRRVRFGVSLELMPLVSLHIEGLSREEAGLLFKVGIRDLKTLASAPAESVLKAIGEKAKKVQPTARELLERMQGSAGDPRETRRFLSTYRINWSDAEEYLGVRLEV